MVQQIPRSNNLASNKQIKQDGNNNMQAIIIMHQFLANLTSKFFCQIL